MSECGCQLDGQVYYVYCSVASTLWSEGNRHDFTTHIRDAVRRLDAAALPAPPSDAEIEAEAQKRSTMPIAWADAAKWMRDLMLQRRPQPEPSGAVKPLVSLDHINDEACRRFIDPQRLGDWVDGARWGVEMHAHKVAVFGPPKIEPESTSKDFLLVAEPSGAAPTDEASRAACRAFTVANYEYNGELVSRERYWDAAVRWDRAQRLPAPAVVDLGDCWPSEEEVASWAQQRYGNPTYGQIGVQNVARTTACWLREYIEVKLHPTPPEPVDPCRAAFVRAFGCEPANDDQLWIGWARSWKAKP